MSVVLLENICMVRRRLLNPSMADGTAVAVLAGAYICACLIMFNDHRLNHSVTVLA